MAQAPESRDRHPSAPSEREGAPAPRSGIDRAIEDAVAEVASETGEAYFRAVAQAVARTLDVRYALICEVVRPDCRKARTRAVWANGAHVENFEYDLAGTPCEDVLSKNLCSFPSDVQQRFPDDHLLVEMEAESYLGTPLFDSRGGTLGLIAALDDRPLDDRERRSRMLLDLVATRTAAEMERARADKALQHRSRQMRIILDAAKRLNAELDVRTVMRELTTSAIELVDGTLGAAGLVQGGRMEFEEIYRDGRLRAGRYRFGPGEGIAGHVLESKAPYLTNDALHDPRLDPEIRKSLGIETLVAVPVLAHTGEVLGCIEIVNAQGGRPFTEDDIEVLSGLADQASVALENALLLEEQRRVEDERRRLVTAIEQAAEMVFVVDGDERVVYANPAFEAITGYAVSEVMGRPWSRFQAPAVGRDPDDELRRTLARGGVWAGQLELERRGGESLLVEGTISPVRDAEGQVTNYVAVQRDVTNEVHLEMQLRQAQKMEAIGTLAGGIAHDFNNLLAAILGFSNLALRRLTEGSKEEGYIQDVCQAGERAKDLVEQILTFSRRREAERRDVRVQDVIQEAVRLLRSTLPATIELVSRVDAACHPVHADPTEVHQVVMNLATNAYHAMKDQGGTLELNLDLLARGEDAADVVPALAAGTYARLEVVDTGPGMEASVRDRIFEPFFTTKPRGEGTGLGLSTVHGIVSGLGGAVAVDSRPGVGTRFRAYLPCVLAREAIDPERIESDVRGEGRVLLVDDEELLVTVGREMLESLGYEVEAFTTSEEALDALRSDPGRCDVVVTDQTMPGYTGLELGVRVRAMRPDLPIVLTTGFSTLATAEALEAAGIRECVRKPFSLRDIGGAVRRALGPT